MVVAGVVAAMQVGKALGARVIATAGGPEKAEFCRSLGADHVVDYRAEDIAEGVAETVMAACAVTAAATQHGVVPVHVGPPSALRAGERCDVYRTADPPSESGLENRG